MRGNDSSGECERAAVTPERAGGLPEQKGDTRKGQEKPQTRAPTAQRSGNGARPPEGAER